LSLAKKIQQKEIGAVELLEFYLQRVEQYNPALNAAGDPILYVTNPAGVDGSVRRRTLDALRDQRSNLVVDAINAYLDPKIRASEKAGAT